MTGRQRKFSARKSSTQLPIGWTHVEPPDPADRHSWYRCPEIGAAIVDGSRLELRRCVVTCRKNQIPSHPSKRSPHRFDLPQQEDADFPRAAQAAADLQTQERVKKAIVNAIALLSLRLQIPVNRVSQPAIGEFIMSILKIGRSIDKADIAQVVEGISSRAISQ